MADPIYEKLAGALNMRGTALPAVICSEFFDFISCAYTPQDAAIYVAMPLGPSTLQEIAENLTVADLEKLARNLGSMEDRGLVHIIEEGGVKLYEGLPLIPGTVEFNMMRGIVDEWNKNFTVKLKSYQKAVGRMFSSEKPPELQKYAPGKTVPVNRDLDPRTTVVPYEEMKELIMRTEYISAGTCVCRHEGALLDKPCTKPVNNCMLLGDSARFSVNKSFARKLTKEEAIKLIDEADAAGLVHTYAYTTGDYFKPLCNCCSCHCGIMRSIRKSPEPGRMVIARYIVEVNSDDCTGCEACIPRCQMEALKMVDGVVARDEKRCIGCGLCISVCPTEALTLKPLPASKIPLTA
ncbi:MAG: 4Fe-4S binding protein [Dehalococcoidia bacterium]|nr:4Fe-4S binding protein [Dehalococcoidia bacterium]